MFKMEGIRNSKCLSICEVVGSHLSGSSSSEPMSSTSSDLKYDVPFHGSSGIDSRLGMLIVPTIHRLGVLAFQTILCKYLI
jgi:hypothetical protein